MMKPLKMNKYNLETTMLAMMNPVIIITKLSLTKIKNEEH